MAGKRKEKVKTKLTLTYLFLIFLAVISILPFYSMIIGCTHDNAALATSFQENIWQRTLRGSTAMSISSEAF